ncbi:Dolichyl-diphosphooligosaccharide-protein glycosyltransferase subunit dad1 [Sarracenia purpurea var. burkii]
MTLSMNPVQTRTFTSASHVAFRCCAAATHPSNVKLTRLETRPPKNLERSLSHPSAGGHSTRFSAATPVRLGKKWMEYQGIGNWEGLLDPLDDILRSEIIRYGHFVDAAYKAFDSDAPSPSYGSCRFNKSSLLEQTGLRGTGYRVTKNLSATSGIRLPRWTRKVTSWVATQSSWIGYVAVCHDKAEIARLGRRDVVVAYRGTATCLEWLENLRATLTQLPGSEGENDGGDEDGGGGDGEAMVESGFLSLYTSGSETNPSLQDLVRKEIMRLLDSYGGEPLSLTITGHSLGAALATLTAYDIKTTFKHAAPLVTVVSFGGPRVGNKSLRRRLEKQGTKILRIVNSDDLITKVPGFVMDAGEEEEEEEGGDLDSNGGGGDVQTAGLSSWIQKWVEDTRWVYADVGRELRLRSRDSPDLAGINVVTCHELKTYLHLVNGGSSACPFRETARRKMKKTK